MSYAELYDDQKFVLQNYCSGLLRREGLDSINSPFRCLAIAYVKLANGTPIPKVVQCQFQEGHFCPHAASLGSISYFYPGAEMGSRGITATWGDGEEPTEEIVSKLIKLAKVEDER